ncbi:MAG: transcriptional repressor [Acidimicrobiia bacterium]|nr:transcriptional repressor [Acidimicrobiia bacterium]
MTHDLGPLLAGRGYRSTRPRQAVWDALQDGAHRTAEEVARAVHEVHPEVNLASIYRTLALLRDLGLVRESRLAGGDQASRWELAHPDEHFHVVCDRCGRVDHHVGSLVAAITEHLSASHRFVPERVELVVHGHCVNCDRDHGHDGGDPWIANPSHH